MLILKRLTFWMTFGLVLSIILVSLVRTDASSGVQIGDSFQLTYEFSGDLRRSYRLPFTSIGIDDRDSSLVVDYTITDFLSDSDKTNYIQFNVFSESISQYQQIVTFPYDLIESYKSFNGSYFQLPYVIPLDFQNQFDLLFDYVNNDIKNNPNIQLLDFGYTNDIDYFEIYFAAKYTNILDARDFQEAEIRYNRDTGIIENYHIVILVDDNPQSPYREEINIRNTTQIPETSSRFGTTPLAIFLISVIIVAIAFYIFKSLSRKNNLETPTIMSPVGETPLIRPPMNDAAPNYQTSDHYETVHSERVKVKVKPKIVKRILCPTCNTINMLDSKYCFECGAYISS